MTICHDNSGQSPALGYVSSCDSNITPEWQAGLVRNVRETDGGGRRTCEAALNPVDICEVLGNKQLRRLQNVC
ncbi:hypothetical protein DPEC_G00015600 [Dallia pectoralis]|uniref:Uncharacterized protein n=1 Tax=Dallia pectoralis TaxID=75939 RepID=A0ACC2HNF3_DALPE|nr:hypothetical protein DPEC_G00015600 [Dallia pectoralis]